MGTTALDKMQVSRAIKGLQDQDCLERVPDRQDGRGWLVHPTASGRALFQKIAPKVRAREAFLLEALSAEEQQVLDRAIKRLADQARRLSQQG